LGRNAGAATYYVYVIDREQRLVGVLTLRELMLAASGRSIAAVMKRSPLSVNANLRHLELIRHSGWHRFHTLPVVDDAGHLMGVVRYETLRRLESEFAGEATSGKSAVNLAVSLSELYVKGLTGLVTGLAPRNAAASKDDGEEGS